jgi:hypothetical protein
MPKNITKTELIMILCSEHNLNQDILKNMTFEAIKQKAIELEVF